MKITPRKIIKAVLSCGLILVYRRFMPVLTYHFHKNKGRFHVYTIEETVKKLLDGRCSMVRFGDGEMGIILGGSIGFQDHDENLAKRLREILGSGGEKLLVCVPDVFEGLEKYKNKQARSFWMQNLAAARGEWEKICVKKNYYNTFVSRPYMDFQDKARAGKHFENIMKLWDNEEVVLVEGRYSRLGCGNDLFSRVKSLERILCPEKNAYQRYDEILKEAAKRDKGKLILVSLGPAAKLLAYDLYQLGYRVLDIGHIDIEYEWYLQGAGEKTPVRGKYVNEARGGRDINDLRIFDDKKYEAEISAEIF